MKHGEPQWVLGTMSGTSLDGVDAALLQTDGVEIFAFGRTKYRPYSDAERKVISSGFGQWDGPAVDAAGAAVTQAHLEVLDGFEADLVGFHGQTLAHDPQGRGTLQVGDGARLARDLDMPVAWDFRSKDVADGGEGAPLAPFYHHALARFIGAHAPVCFLNLGGVGNITWVDPGIEAPEHPGALVAFDTGPANAPINDLVTARRGLAFDKDGAAAAAGQVDADVVARFLEHPYSNARCPSPSTGTTFQTFSSESRTFRTKMPPQR